MDKKRLMRQNTASMTSDGLIDRLNTAIEDTKTKI